METPPQSPPTPEEDHTAAPEEGEDYSQTHAVGKVQEAIDAWERHKEEARVHRTRGRHGRAQGREDQATAVWRIKVLWQEYCDRFGWRRP